MEDFRGVRAESVAELVRSGATSAREQVERALAVIDACNARVGAFLAVDGDRALADADAIDRRIAAGEPVGPLAGVPVGVKDEEDVIGFRTTYGSALHVEDAAAKADSAHVARLRAAGCIPVGKTNLPEFAFQADTVNRIAPPTRNPWNLARSAGGSSGGSAAALAAGMVPLATGSDAGGSIRIPSAATGLSGLKPSLGRVPDGGRGAPLWLHLSCSAPMAQRISDVALALDAVTGPDALDLHTLPPHHGESWRRSVDNPHPPRRVLWSEDLGYGRVDRDVAAACRAAVDALADAGTEIVEVPAVFASDPVVSWLTIGFSGILRRVEHLRGTAAWDQLDPGLRSMMALVEGATATDLARAIDAGHELNARLVELFHPGSVLLCPTLAGLPGPVGAQGLIDGQPDPGFVAFTYPFNLTGSPAGSVCVGFARDGMPIGLQVVGPRHADVAVLRTIAYLESLLEVDAVAPLDWV